MGDVVFPVFPSSGQVRAALGSGAASYAADCDAYVELLDDALARYAVLAAGDIAWGDTAQIWLRDATRLLGEIRGRSAAIRLAVPVAERFSELRLCVDIVESHRPHHVDQPNGLLADARAVNEDLKSRLNPPRGNGFGAPILHPVGPTAGSPERPKAEQALPIIAERTSLQSLGDEACSAIFHGAEVLRALAAMAVLGLAALRRSVRRLLSHVGLPHHAKSVSGTRLSVIRNDRPSFRPQPDDFFPGGGSAA